MIVQPTKKKRRAKRLKAGDRDYVSNPLLFAALLEYLKEKQINVDTQPSDYIVRAIMLICQRRLNSFNFVKYDFKDEMLSDAYMDCFRDLTKFNPDKSQNPFAYFTTIADNAFIRRIKIEKLQLYTKYTMIDEVILFEEQGTNIQQYGDSEESRLKDEFMQKYEQSQRDAKERSRLKKIEKDKLTKKSLI